MNVLKEFCCPLLRYSIVPLYGFCFFAAITDISFNIINKDNVVIGEMFFQQGKIKLTKTLMPTGEGQLFVLHLMYIRFFAFVNIIIFEEADDYYQ